MTESLPTSISIAAPSHLLYLYCVLKNDTGAKRLLDDRCVPGLQPHEPLFSIETSGLAGAVSRVPAATFQSESLDALMKDLPRLAPIALGHDEAIRALLPHTPALVPMALGAVYASPQGIIELLRGRAEELHHLLARLEDKQEWGLKVFKDSAILAEAAAANSDQHRGLAVKAAEASPGRAYLIRKQQERLLVKESARLITQWLDEIVKRLSTMSAAVSIDQLPPVQAGDSRPLALKAAFLVEVDRIETFRSVAGELGHTYESLGLRVEVNGPWAPYSFIEERHGPA